MKIRSPSLPELHAFVAVARLGSALKAAEHLHVTQGAVSRAIQRLEEYLGQSLFDRHRRGSALNDAGAQYLRAVAPALDALEAAAAKAQRVEDPATLRLSVIPTFASNWLIRRLPAFQQSHPEIRLSFVPYRRDDDLGFADVHATIRGGDGALPKGLAGDYLIGRHIVPVCRPADLANAGPIASPCDLRTRPLLFHTSQPQAWKIWFAALGCDAGSLELHLGFDQVSQLLEAAAAGLGIAMVQRCLASDYIDSGRLTLAWSEMATNTRGYYLLYPSEGRQRHALEAFRLWLLQEAQAAEQTEQGPGARGAETSAPNPSPRARRTSKAP